MSEPWEVVGVAAWFSGYRMDVPKKPPREVAREHAEREIALITREVGAWPHVHVTTSCTDCLRTAEQHLRALCVHAWQACSLARWSLHGLPNAVTW